MTQGEPDETGAVAGALHDLGRLSRWAAHEINNPLGGIQNAFALIRDAVPPDHPHFKYVGAIDREIARIAALTQRLHHTYGQDGERSAPQPIARAISDALHALKPLYLARRVEVEVNISPSATSEQVAGEVASRAIRHLAQHGIESAPPDSTVRLRVWRDADLIWFAIPGQEPEAPVRGSAVAGPPGLALQLVRKLVAALNGEISFNTGPDGQREIHVGVPILKTAKEAV